MLVNIIHNFKNYGQKVTLFFKLTGLRMAQQFVIKRASLSDNNHIAKTSPSIPRASSSDVGNLTNRPLATDPVTIEVDRSTELPLVSLPLLLVDSSPSQSIAVHEIHVQVKQHPLSRVSSSLTEQLTYSDHQFRAPEMRLERLTDQYWFPESGFLISRNGKAWRHSILGQYADPNFLTTYAVGDQLIDDGSRIYNFYEHLLQDAPVISAPCLITSHYASHNFGHFMLDIVPLLHFAKQHHLEIISKPLLEWQRPIYRTLGFDDNAVATFGQRAVFLKNVIVSNRHNAESTYAASPHHREVFESVLQNIKRSTPNRRIVTENQSSRIFLSRGRSKSRDIRNRDALEAALRKIGFDIIRPELLSFERQAILFAKADTIVSEFGASMANVVFCKLGTKIIEIIPENQNDPWSSHLCASMGLEHVTLFHEVKDEDRETIEIGGRAHTNIFFKFDADIDLVIKCVKQISNDDILKGKSMFWNKFNKIEKSMKNIPTDATQMILATTSDKSQTVSDLAPPLTEQSKPLPPEGLTLRPLPGVNYIDYLADLVIAKKAVRYLEVGTNFGSSLAPINCASIAVDPQFRLSLEVIGKKPTCMFFQMTSDDFFATHDPAQLLGGKLDVAFLDGMHLYEYLLRDFIATEKHCHNNSLIILHDCVPPTFEMTNRNFRPAVLNPNYLNYWTGDVWKIMPLLLKYRPDLKVAYVDCPPSGLVIISNCDPTSTILSDNYEEIVNEYLESNNDLNKLTNFVASIALLPSQTTKAAMVESIIWQR
jgi:capsular polysaccharide biosynthesis protein